MSTDAAAPLPQAPRPDWELPEIIEVTIRPAEYRPRKPRHFESPLREARNAVEVVVTLKSPLPIRAMGPVLYVGNTQLTESEALDKEGRQIRFWGFDRAALAAGAPISMGWTGSRSERRRSKFTFRLGE
jgi:hypothetical protein